MDSDGARARRLASADTGHGFAPEWSSDSTRIAFVIRENPKDPRANQAETALLSNLRLVRTVDGEETSITDLKSARVEAARWQPGSENIAFPVSADDRMNVFVMDITTGTSIMIPIDMVTCPFWLRG
jgi:Tol biopolymer transport system component